MIWMPCRRRNLARTRAGVSRPALYLVGDADRESRGHHAAGAARAEGSGRDRLRGHAADAEVAQSLCDRDADDQLSRAQRDDEVGGAGERDAGGRERGAGDRRGDAGDFRSGVPADYAGDSASCAGGADPGGIGVSGGAGGERAAHGFVSLQRISSGEARGAAGGAGGDQEFSADAGVL